MKKYYDNEQYEMVKTAVREVLQEKENEEKEPEEYNVLDYILIGLAVALCICGIVFAIEGFVTI